MAREISLSGGETTVIKALGTGGAFVSGTTLMERLGNMEKAELLDTLQGLIDMDYVVCDFAGGLRRTDDLEKANFKVDPGAARDLREALNPKNKTREQPRRRRG